MAESPRPWRGWRSSKKGAPAEEQLLGRVLVGLLENAIKFSPQGAQIRIRSTAQESGLLLAIEDQGPGVPIELTEEIFDRHFTGGRGGASGTGIGLAIVRNLTESVGGRVWVESAGNGGARFCCSFPSAAGIRRSAGPRLITSIKIASTAHRSTAALSLIHGAERG